MLSVNRRSQSSSGEKAIGFGGAVRIPGVFEYSLALFFAKLVSYTFLYWLPLYISSSSEYLCLFTSIVQDRSYSISKLTLIFSYFHTAKYSPSESADLSTLFDVGGIAGAIAAGVLSDWSGMSAVTCAVMLVLAIPAVKN